MPKKQDDVYIVTVRFGSDLLSMVYNLYFKHHPTGNDVYPKLYPTFPNQIKRLIASELEKKDLLNKPLPVFLRMHEHEILIEVNSHPLY